MSKIFLINDLHNGVKNDAKYVIDYQEKFYSEVFFPTLKKHNVKKGIIGGDVFDRRKYINFGTLSRTRKMLFDELEKNDIETDIFIGNHDTFSKSTNDINSIRLLLKEYKNINIIEQPIVKKYDELSMMLVPWINGANHKEFMDYIDNNNADILYGHFEIKGFAMHSADIKSKHGINPESFKKFDQVISGHFHTQSKGNNIRYLGAPMQFTWADYNDPRGFHLLDTDNKQFTFVENPFILYEKIFYNDEGENAQADYASMDVSQYDNKIVKMFVVNKTNSEVFESFVDRLTKRNLIALSITEDFSKFHESQVEIENVSEYSTKDLMGKFIDGVDTEMDKVRLKTILFKWHIEAQYTQSGTSE